MPFSFIERVLGILLTLPIPFYKSLIYVWITNSRGSSIFGMYIRALYYRRPLNNMESNVFIDQGVLFAHPKGVTLREFSYIDKQVMILCMQSLDDEFTSLLCLSVAVDLLKSKIMPVLQQDLV